MRVEELHSTKRCSRQSIGPQSSSGEKLLGAGSAQRWCTPTLLAATTNYTKRTEQRERARNQNARRERDWRSGRASLLLGRQMATRAHGEHHCRARRHNTKAEREEHERPPGVRLLGRSGLACRERCSASTHGARSPVLVALLPCPTHLRHQPAQNRNPTGSSRRTDAQTKKRCSQKSMKT